MHKIRNNLLSSMQLCLVLLWTTLITVMAQAQTSTTAAANDNRGKASRAPAVVPRRGFFLTPASFRLTPAASARTSAGSRSSLTPMAANLQVFGSGTLVRLTKWVGFTGRNSFIGDSSIFESKTALVGIGTDSPTSMLTVAGMIETTLGGVKFPDGTVQTISASGPLFSVAHDSTLTGNGTAASPLGVAIPLNLTGSEGGSGGAILNVMNTGDGFGISVSANTGIRATGRIGGRGVLAEGGAAESGGEGVEAHGGTSLLSHAVGGTGVVAFGGNSSAGAGGVGVRALGGSGASGRGGDGVFAIGADSANDNGGVGVIAGGGISHGAGKTAGTGIFAVGGLGIDGAADGDAGVFIGNVTIVDDLNVTGTKNFKIDHPLDPENKYLYHAAIESSEVLNVYSGNVTTNEQGEAVVMLPDWFEALNKDLRYQLTVIGTFAQAIVAEKVKHNRFTIKTNAPNVEVSWQVTGVRSDAAMLKRPFKAEEEKPERERGTYLNPGAFNHPEERGLEWARHPEMMPRMKEAREQVKQRAQANNH
jgi:hypothetical protein